jgi:hypothetical protein
MTTRHRARGRRVVTAAAAAVLFVVPFAATRAGSAAITQPVTVVTSVDNVPSGTATVGKSSIVDFTVTNRSTNGAKLGLFTIVVPKSASGVMRAGISPPSWTEVLLPCGSTPRCSALMFASATRTSGFLPSGASVKVSIKFTPTAAGTLSFPMLGIGNGLFTATSTPTITVAPAAIQTSLRITSITDAGLPPLPVLAAGRAFKVAFQVVDSAGNVVTSPDVTVKLSALNLGPLATLSTSQVTTSNGTGVITATYLGPGINGLTLQLTSTSVGGPLPVISAVSLAADGLTINASPGQGIDITIGNISLATGTARAILRNGAVGDLTFTVGPCVPDQTTPDCAGIVSEVALLGNLDALYSVTAPAELDWSCNPATCTAPDPGQSLLTLQNTEFKSHPIMVASSDPKGASGLAPACSDTGETTGQITGERAVTLGFCVDVGAISRSSEECGEQVCTTWSGNLTIPVLFLNDPRFYMG